MVSFEGQTMLIVDDEEDLCQYTKSYFQRRKFKVLIASNGEQALIIAKKENPHIILLDVMLGDMSGIELLRKLRAQNILSQVIMITGHVPDQATQDILKELNVFKYFQKPIVLGELEETVKSALDTK